MTEDKDMQHRVGGAVADAVAQALGVPSASLDWNAGLMGMGLDSLTITQLCSSLNEQYGLLLIPPVLFEHPTIAALAKHLLEEYPDAFGPAPAAGTLEKAAAQVAAAGPAAAVERPIQIGPGVSDEPVAIVGMSACLPGAPDVRTFWARLDEGADCITEVPSDRWDWRALWGDPQRDGERTDIRWGGFIGSAADFDPLFFDISPREALLMDPGQRLMLEHVWNAIEDAGCAAASLAGTHTAIFAGVGGSGYDAVAMAANVSMNGASVVGISPTFGPSRLSYLLDLHGPSEPVETACSGSLVAIHRAVESLRTRACEVAIAGGVSVIATSSGHIAFSKAGMLSRDGRCKAFAQAADGYARSEGVAFFVLKRLSDAESNRDRIYGLILATGENHGGRASSLTAPNPAAQAELIADVWRRAGVDPRSIGYIEAHGTGTVLGDAVEIKGLTQAFAQLHAERGVVPRAGQCALGSVKSNIGHLEAAAGAAGLVKVLLQLQHRALVRSLHCEPLNPLVTSGTSPFRISREAAPWPQTLDDAGRELPRRAGLSSFGIGGVNAHIAIEEYVAPNAGALAAGGSQTPQIFVLSARTTAALRERASSLLALFQSGELTDTALPDIAFTLREGRNAMEHRLAFAASDVAEACRALEQFLSGRTSSSLYVGRVSRERNAFSYVSDDEHMQDAVARWIERGAWSKVLSLWVCGLNLDWARVCRTPAGVRRIGLPGYPFARERYWLESATAVSMPSPTRSNRRATMLARRWDPEPLVPASERIEGVLILASSETCSLAEELAARLAKARVLDADIGPPADLDWAAFAGWIDLVGCGRQPHRNLQWTKALQRWIEGGAGSLLKALCITRGLESLAQEEINLAGALHAGLYPALQSEYSRLQSRVVDVDPGWHDSRVVECVLQEWDGHGRGVRACHRNGVRHEARLAEIDFDGTGTVEANVFPADHVLWITGGTRGIGALCAQHFASRYGVRRIVIAGREALPPRDQWPAFETLDTAVARKIRALLALEKQGAVVRTCSVPLSDEQALRDEIDDVRRTLGPIGGVIHAAGLGDGTTPAFVRKSVEGMGRVLEPKVHGTDNLVRCFESEPLRFFVTFSSVAAAIPSLGTGQSDYAMANAYMDHLVQAHASRLPVVSVQWPSWKTTGMGEVKSETYRRTGLLSIEDAEGLSFLEAVIARRPSAVVMPAVVDDSCWRPHELMLASSRSTVQEKAADTQPESAKATGDESTLLSAVKVELLALVAAQLSIEPSRLEADVPLPDYGVDSVLLSHLARSIGDWVDTELSPTLLYEHVSIDELSRWLVQHHRAAVAARVSGKQRDEGAAPVVSPPAKIESPVRVAPSPAHDDSRGLDIAIVGMSCRFAGAPTLSGYWSLLSEGRCGIAPVPADRWGRATRSSAGLLADVRHFDPEFFGIALSDARAMDPQALIVLEESLNAIHHAGYTTKELCAQPIGVFVGGRSQVRGSRRALADAQNATMAAGQNYLAANVSRVFDLRGPSLVVDTACSSALTAMSIAASFLATGEISAALVAGVGVLHTDAPLRLFERRGILQPDGRFHIFDRRAAGAVLGEGAGVVMLKRLSQALVDGDRVYGVIKGLALNNDGRTAGPTAPNLAAQKLVLSEALARSGLASADVTHVEVNGSGSEVSDLLELKAIEAVYGIAGRGECDLGSVKPNIGHPLCAEGIASFIKVVLMLHHRQRVPFLSGHEPMKHYDFAASPFRFTRTTTPWTGVPAAGINCFADGGTNAHVVLQAAAHSTLASARRTPTAPPELARVEVFGKPSGDRKRVRRRRSEPGAKDFGFWGSGVMATPMEETVE